MSIVLNEREWAAGAIANNLLGDNPVLTLDRVARYYHQCERYSKKEVRSKLDEFLLRSDPYAVLAKWDDTLDRIVKASDKKPVIEIDGVSVTKAELDTISKIGSIRTRRLAFTLLCVAKYWNLVRATNNNWVNTPDNEIMKMANITTSIKYQSLMFNELWKSGLLGFSKRVDNLNVRVNYIDEDSPEEIFVSDLRNLGNRYMMYIGEPYFECEYCGLVTKRKSNAQKYCADCAAEIHSRHIRRIPPS